MDVTDAEALRVAAISAAFWPSKGPYPLQFTRVKGLPPKRGQPRSDEEQTTDRDQHHRDHEG